MLLYTSGTVPGSYELKKEADMEIFLFIRTDT